MSLLYQCAVCTNSLYSGQSFLGLTHGTCEKQLCQKCYMEQYESKFRIDKIRTSLENIDSAKSELIKQENILEETKDEIRHQHSIIENEEDVLNAIEYVGQDDPYHKLIHEYY